VSAARIEIRAGGTPTPAHLAALAAAVAAVVDDERAGPPEDPPGAGAYRSRWRRAGIAESIRPGARA